MNENEIMGLFEMMLTDEHGVNASVYSEMLMLWHKMDFRGDAYKRGLEIFQHTEGCDGRIYYPTK